MMKKNYKNILWILALAVPVMMWADEELSAFDRFRMVRQLELDANESMVDGDYKDAASTFLKAAKMETHRDRQAQFILKAADAYYKAEKGNRALEQYKKLLEDYSLHVPYEHVVEQLRGLAEHFVKGEMTFLWLKDVGGAIKIYELIIREAPATHISRNDRFRLAELLRKEDRPEEAVAQYQAMLKQNPRDWDVRVELAHTLERLAKISDGDGSKMRAAVREAKLVLISAPDHAKAADMRKLLANAEEMDAKRLLEQAKFYMVKSHRRLPAARRYLHDVISKYPDSEQAAKARELLMTNPELVELERQATGQGDDATVATEPAKAEEPNAAEVKTEEPKAEEQKAAEVKTEEPKAEEPKAAEVKAEEPKAEEPKAAEVKAEEPKAEEPKAEEPKAENSQEDSCGGFPY